MKNISAHIFMEI